MATSTSMIVQLRVLLGDMSKRQYKEYELLKLLQIAINKTSGDVCKDALRTLINTSTDTIAALSSTLELPSDCAEVISLQITDPCTSQSHVWNRVDFEELTRLKELESNQIHESSAYRLYSIHNDGDLYLYPQPSIGQTYILKYIEQPSISGTMTLPDKDPDLQTLALYCAAYLAKVSDPTSNMYQRYLGLYEDGISKINHTYYNKYNLSPAGSFQITVI